MPPRKRLAGPERSRRADRERPQRPSLRGLGTTAGCIGQDLEAKGHASATIIRRI